MLPSADDESFRFAAKVGRPFLAVIHADVETARNGLLRYPIEKPVRGLERGDERLHAAATFIICAIGFLQRRAIIERLIALHPAAEGVAHEQLC